MKRTADRIARMEATKGQAPTMPDRIELVDAITGEAVAVIWSNPKKQGEQALEVLKAKHEARERGIKTVLRTG